MTYLFSVVHSPVVGWAAHRRGAVPRGRGARLLPLLPRAGSVRQSCFGCAIRQLIPVRIEGVLGMLRNTRTLTHHICCTAAAGWLHAVALAPRLRRHCRCVWSTSTYHLPLLALRLCRAYFSGPLSHLHWFSCSGVWKSASRAWRTAIGRHL